MRELGQILDKTVASEGRKRTTGRQLHFVGLNDGQVERSHLKYGKNEMTRKRKRTLPEEFLSNLGDPIIRVLLISLAVNVLFTFGNIDWLEVGGIVLAIILATGISTLSEHSSREAFEKLNSSASRSTVRVRRNGKTVEISVSEVAVGDIVLVSSGEKIAADGVLLSGEVSLDQSALTGESREARKEPAQSEIIKRLLDAVTADESERGRGELSALCSDGELLSPSSASSCLKGAAVSGGEGEMLVLRVGDESFLGSVVSELQGEVRDSPLKERLSRLAKQISALGYGAAVIIALLTLFSSFVIESDFSREVIMSKLTDPKFVASELLHALTLGLTVVIMAVPEGLPMMIAVVLSSNVKKMLADMVLVRKSAGIEAAGSMNILFTDKTGTLTQGRMSVEEIILPGGERVRSAHELKRLHPDVFASLSENAVCNSSAEYSRRGPLGGNATERALLKFVRGKRERDSGSVVRRLAFDSKNKYSLAVLDGATYLKGAPDVLLPFSADGSATYALECEIARAQSEGKRVIVACEGIKKPESTEIPPLAVTCAVVLSDAIKREAAGSVQALCEAGVGVVMITGDGLLTARSVGCSVGIVNQRRDLCIEHSELEKMSGSEVVSILPRLAVLARALPSDKSRLVRLSQSRGLVVGMTGDGINDAPALRAADVGFAMGDGDEIAKDAGSVVILDNNLSSIVKAVLYGRNIFKSIRKFLVFQLTMNFSSALVCMIGPLVGVESPITVTQMLWVNMIMDTLGGIAFAGEAPVKRALREKPKRRDEPILNAYMTHQIIVSGSFSVLLSVLFLKSPLFVSHFRGGECSQTHLSAFFALFIFLGVMQCVNSRTDRLNLFSGMRKNMAFVLVMCLITVIQLSFVYFGGSALRAAPLEIDELVFTVACAASAIPFEFGRKIIWRVSGHATGF